MRVTLYKGCILSNSYNEVFDVTPRQETESGISIFEDYLSTLEKRVFQLDQVYITNSGTLNFPLEVPNDYTDLYEFNYMKVEYESIVRYCFIDDITLGNELGVISYSEDIWHSYSNTMSIRNSLLVNSKKLNYNDFEIKLYRPPEAYDGNNIPIIERIDDYNPNYYVIAKLQVYDKTASGKVSKRRSLNVIISNSMSEIETENISNCLSLIQNATIYASSKSVEIGDTTYENYDIDEFKIIPTPYMFNIGLTYSFSAKVDIDGNEIYFYAFSIGHNVTDKYGEITLGKSYTIKKDFKTISFGFISSQYEIEQNGTDIDFRLGFYSDSFNFNVFLLYQNKVIDISDNFTVTVPMEYLSGSENSLRNMSRTIKTIKSTAETIAGIVQLAYGGGFSVGGKSIRNTITNSTTSGGKKVTKISRRKGHIVSSNTEWSPRSRVSSNYTTTTYEPSTTNSGIMLIDGISGLLEANSEVYTSNQASFIDSIGALNAKFGLCVFKINPDNEYKIERLINNIGYNVYEIVDDILKIYQDDYNVVRFDFVNIYGSFTQKIKEYLKTILLNGVKIWYTKEVG